MPGEDFKVTKIKVRNPERETWNYLSLYSKKDYVLEKLKKTHLDLKQKELESTAFQINTCITHAKEYYVAAEVATLSTKPLLLYYGMYSLAKALIFLSDPKIDLETLKSHGLKPEIENIERLLDTQITVLGAGLFYHFRKYSINNRFVVEIVEENPQYTNTGYSALSSDFSQVERGRIMLLQDLLSSLPDLDYLLEYFLPRSQSLLNVDLEVTKNISENWTRFIAFTKPNTGFATESLLRICPEITADEKTFESNDLVTFEKSRHKTMLKDFSDMIPKRLVQSMSQELFLVFADKPVSELYAQLATMFVFGYIVRYKPPLWQQILETDYSTLIEKFVTISKEKFPLLILSELSRELFIFE